MIVYNITIKIDSRIEDEWLLWQKNEHIPDIMSTGIFTEFKFFRLLEQDETDGISYVMQYFTSSFDNYKNYIEKFAPSLHEKAFERWGNLFIAFHTVMKIVN